jgi:hypothetical protein
MNLAFVNWLLMLLDHYGCATELRLLGPIFGLWRAERN